MKFSQACPALCSNFRGGLGCVSACLHTACLHSSIQKMNPAPLTPQCVPDSCLAWQPSTHAPLTPLTSHSYLAAFNDPCHTYFSMSFSMLSRMAAFTARWQASVMSAPEKPCVYLTSRSKSTSGATGDLRRQALKICSQAATPKHSRLSNSPLSSLY